MAVQPQALWQQLLAEARQHLQDFATLYERWWKGTTPYPLCPVSECAWCTKGKRVHQGDVFTPEDRGCSEWCGESIEQSTNPQYESISTGCEPHLYSVLPVMYALNHYIYTVASTNDPQDTHIVRADGSVIPNVMFLAFWIPREQIPALTREIAEWNSGGDDYLLLTGEDAGRWVDKALKREPYKSLLPYLEFVWLEDRVTERRTLYNRLLAAFQR